MSATVEALESENHLHVPAVDRDGYGRALEDVLQQSDNGPAIALLIVDINGFRDINFRFGHRAGDTLLSVLAQLFKKTLRDVDQVWRIGDDEFALILPSVQGGDHATLAAAKIHDALRKPIDIGEDQIDVRGSIGITAIPPASHDGDSVTRFATIALRRAKAKHRGYALYDPSERDVDELPRGYMTRLRKAISESRLELFYQAKVDFRKDRVAGAEALVRWKDEEIGFRSPDEFIPIAERSDLIDLLTRWTINAGLSQCAHWHESGYPIGIAINLSARSITNSDLPVLTQRALDTWRIDPGFLTLEITETAMMEEQTLIIPALERLSGLGVKLSIDDFGTGYSSLAYLRSLPVNELKIDKSFVLNIDTEEDDRIIVKTIIELGKNFGLKVTAEGIESAESYRILQQLGCDLGQGFYMTRPMNTQDFTNYLAVAAREDSE